jgi:hypothetical protein
MNLDSPQVGRRVEHSRQKEGNSLCFLAVPWRARKRDFRNLSFTTNEDWYTKENQSTRAPEFQITVRVYKHESEQKPYGFHTRSASSNICFA